jgi:hypothetical protein
LSVDANNQNMSAGSTTAAFNMHPVNGERTADRIGGGGGLSDHFASAATKLGLPTAFQGFNGYISGGGGNHHQQQNGHNDLYHQGHPTYSSHPNLIGRPNGVVVNGGGGSHHRKLPPLPNKPSALKLGQWRQSSLPEEHNPPGYGRQAIPPLPPSDRPVAIL